MPRPSLDPAVLYGIEVAHLVDAPREEWLMGAVALCHDIFLEAGYQLPKVRVSCSFPGGGSPKRRIGECWPTGLSELGINEIYISPYIEDTVQVLDVLVHELCHAVDDCKSMHGKGFKAIAEAVGLEGKMRMAAAGPALRQQLTFMAEALGPYPHRKLKATGGGKKRSKSTHRWRCDSCECVFQLTKAMAAKYSVAFCPSCGEDASQGGQGPQPA